MKEFKGKLLVSQFSQESIFANKVILLVVEDEIGFTGVALNGIPSGKLIIAKTDDKSVMKTFDDSWFKIKNMEVDAEEKMKKLYEELEKSSISNYDLIQGGLKGNQIMFLHGYDDFNESEEEAEETFELGNLLDDTKDVKPYNCEITDGVYFGSPYAFADIYEAGLIPEKKFRILTGCTEWTKEQLKEEIELGLWKVIDATPKVVFNDEEIEKILKNPNNFVKEEKPESDFNFFGSDSNSSFFGWNPNG